MTPHYQKQLQIYFEEILMKTPSPIKTPLPPLSWLGYSTVYCLMIHFFRKKYFIFRKKATPSDGIAGFALCRALRYATVSDKCTYGLTE